MTYATLLLGRARATPSTLPKPRPDLPTPFRAHAQEALIWYAALPPEMSDHERRVIAQDLCAG